MPTRPGITVFPVISSTLALGGYGLCVLAVWTAVILPPAMSMRMSSWGAEPVPSIRRTCSSTSTGASSFTYSFNTGESGEGFCWAAEVRLNDVRLNDNDKDMHRIAVRRAVSMVGAVRGLRVDSVLTGISFLLARPRENIYPRVRGSPPFSHSFQRRRACWLRRSGPDGCF